MLKKPIEFDACRRHSTMRGSLAPRALAGARRLPPPPARASAIAAMASALRFVGLGREGTRFVKG